nr:EOG090X06KU [Eulimnadia texana]
MEITESAIINTSIIVFLLQVFVVLLVECFGTEYPEGYYPFEESPTRNPPKVRKPPYAQADINCPGIVVVTLRISRGERPITGQLVRDLNKGYIPKNPLGHDFSGQSYPFELLRNKTLDFFSSTLPILKEDKDLPKVAKYDDFEVIDSTEAPPFLPFFREFPCKSGNTDTDVHHKKLRKSLYSFCSIYKLFNNRFLSSGASPIERAENSDLFSPSSTNNKQNLFSDDPLTPCPSAAEYVTPVYAKNYQGVWRYVVQIPYEGYFTQTVEVTKCLRKKCHFMNGSCLASPRWLSLLVAELFYPHARFPATKPASLKAAGEATSRKRSPPSSPELPFVPRQFSLPLGLAQRTKRDTSNPLVSSTTAKPTYCDGVDEIGCFQVRLYYDWFLVPGSFYSFKILPSVLERHMITANQYLTLCTNVSTLQGNSLKRGKISGEWEMGKSEVQHCSMDDNRGCSSNQLLYETAIVSISTKLFCKTTFSKYMHRS